MLETRRPSSLVVADEVQEEKERRLKKVSPTVVHPLKSALLEARLEDVKDPKVKEPTDAIVALTAGAICGTDLHMIRGTLSGMQKGTILGHEGVGVIEEIGKGVRDLSLGDRVVIPSDAATVLITGPVTTRSVTKLIPTGPMPELRFSGARKAAGLLMAYRPKRRASIRQRGFGETTGILYFF